MYFELLNKLEMWVFPKLRTPLTKAALSISVTWNEGKKKTQELNYLFDFVRT